MAIITISRGTFSGGKAIAECVAQKLGYKCVSREMLQDAARDYGLSLDELSEALDTPPGIIHGSDRTRRKYLAYIRLELLKEIQEENVVYHGLAGNLLLQDIPHLLSVKVDASMEHRLEAAMESTNLLRNEVVDIVNRIDRKRDKWAKYLYNVDRNDPSLYDMVINLDQTDNESACEQICAKASDEKYQRTPESQKRLNDLILAAEVKARINSDSILRDGHIKVDADEGMIILSGIANFMKDADRARIVASETPGVRGINSKMRVKVVTHNQLL